MDRFNRPIIDRWQRKIAGGGGVQPKVPDLAPAYDVEGSVVSLTDGKADAAIVTATDPTKWATETAGSTRAERDYYCADFRGNVAAMVGSAGNLVEQYRYGPSGVPYGIPLGDMNADGVVDGAKGAADYVLINNIIAASGYEVRADLNLDGKVDKADAAIVTANTKNSTGRGKLSVGAVGNRLGPSGYQFAGIGQLLMSPGGGRVISASLSIGLNADPPDSLRDCFRTQVSADDRR